ncbi:MAG: hypothetical protein AB1689_00715 [Thermodesulfobacteriota bacterium]
MNSPLIGTIVGLAAAVLLAGSDASEAGCPDRAMTLAQAGGSGVNSPATGAAPKTDVAPGGTTGEEDDAAEGRTSKSFGRGHPLAGDEVDERRPDADDRSGENAIDADEPRGPRGVD